LGRDSHHEKAIYFFRPNEFTIIKVIVVSAHTLINKGRKRIVTLRQVLPFPKAAARIA